MKKIAILFALLMGLSLLKINAQPTWTQKANHPGNPKFEFGAFSENGKGYIAGGRNSSVTSYLSETQQYDPATNAWSTMASLPMAFSGVAAFQVGNFGYIVMGMNDVGYNYATLRYNQTGNTWSALATNPAANRQFAAATGNGTNGYMIGGLDVSANPLGDLWEYNPTSGNWTSKEALPANAARYYATSFSLGGNVYVFGGLNFIGDLNDLWKFDVPTGHWAAVASLPGLARLQPISFVINNDAYIVGGMTFSGTPLKEVWKYTATTNSWTQLPNFPGTTAPFGGGAFVVNGKGYVVPGNTTSECWEFSPGPSGIGDITSQSLSISISPNPVTSQSTLYLPADKSSGPFSIEIFNVYGQLVKSINTDNSSVTIDRNDFAEGIYFLRVQDKAQKTGTLRFVVQ